MLNPGPTLGRDETHQMGINAVQDWSQALRAEGYKTDHRKQYQTQKHQGTLKNIRPGYGQKTPAGDVS